MGLFDVVMMLVVWTVFPAVLTWLIMEALRR